MKKNICLVLSLIMLTALGLAMNIQPAYARTIGHIFTKTWVSTDISGSNYVITYHFKLENTSPHDPFFPDPIFEDISIKDTIHGINVKGSDVPILTFPGETVTIGGTPLERDYSYTTKPEDIDFDGTTRSVTNIAYVHYKCLDTYYDIPASCTVPLNPVGSVPELPAGLLLGVGLAGIGTFIVIKRKQGENKTRL
jgi:hypothetical protein